MGLFKMFREEGWNTYYPGRHVPVIGDLTHIIVIISCIVFTSALLILACGTRGNKKKITSFLRILLGLHTGVILLISVTGQSWLRGEIQTSFDYSLMSETKCQALIDITIGLKSMNITFTKLNISSFDNHEHITEQFNFNKVHDMEDEFEFVKKKGLPVVFLYVVEYLSMDSGDIRWQRSMRAAGYFSYILLWSAFALWIISQILLCFLVVRGAIVVILCGVTMVTGCILYHFLQPTPPLEIVFEDGKLTFFYGWCYWLCIISGILTLVTGLCILGLHKVNAYKLHSALILDRTRLDQFEEEREKTLPERSRKISILHVETPILRHRKRKGGLIGTDNQSFQLEEKNSETRDTTHAKSDDVINICVYKDEENQVIKKGTNTKHIDNLKDSPDIITAEIHL